MIKKETAKLAKDKGFYNFDTYSSIIDIIKELPEGSHDFIMALDNFDSTTHLIKKGDNVQIMNDSGSLFPIQDLSQGELLYLCGEFNLTMVCSQEKLRKWLREKHQIEMYIVPMKLGYRLFSLAKGHRNLMSSLEHKIYFVTYEQALEKGLIYGLNQI